MSETIGYKGLVATKPFSKRGVEVKANSAFGTIAQKTALEGLEVVFGNGVDIHPGDTVFVNGDGAKSWGNNVLEVLGQQVILCQPASILLVKKNLLGTVTETTKCPPVPAKPEPTRAPGPGILA